MAKIQNVDYEAIPAKASAMRQAGTQLNQELLNMYQKITDMHNAWYGKRYHTLVLDFNAMVPQLNAMIDLVVSEIPFTLETVSNNYSKVDQGTNIVAATKTLPTKIVDIMIAEDVGMRFLESEVGMTRQQVSNALENAKQMMNQIDSILGQVKWQSEASEAFRTKFAQLKASITTAFDNINNQFAKLITQAQTDMQSTESANTVQ